MEGWNQNWNINDPALQRDPEPGRSVLSRPGASADGPSATGGFCDLCCCFNLDKDRTKEPDEVFDGLVLSASTGSSSRSHREKRS